jgi:gamma-glutamyltranspeptidase/glutathione hydrolase
LSDKGNQHAVAYPYSSRRQVVFGRRGMVATAHPLAAQAGLEVMRQGGNAIDAAVAAAACLTVVEPTSNGIGGDAFAIIWHQGRLYGLNSSGPAPQGISVDWVKAQGYETMPAFGWPAVTVPGAPAAWAVLAERFGRLPLTRTLAPAIEVAREGHPVAPTVAFYWQRGVQRLSALLKTPEYAEWYRVFAPNGRGPYPGEIWRMPDHADTLELIAQTKAQAFYQGSLAERLVRFSQETGGIMAMGDLADYQPEWVQPLSTSYRGHDVWELPPNGQGLVALMALQMLDGLEPDNDAERLHFQIEALKLAFADAAAYLADPRYMPYPPEAFLHKTYGEARRGLIGPLAATPVAGHPVPSGTVYLATADAHGNMVSYIQSNYRGFGSGLVVPGTGIALQDRGELFSLTDGHPNRLEPGKRPYHTIIPGFLTRGGQAVGPFGVMGGFMQPQGHVQVLARTLDDGCNPQAALDAPRFYWREGRHVAVEPTMPPAIIDDLTRRGHEVEIEPELGLFGRGEIIWRSDDGVLAGGTEPRADGYVAVW